MKTIPVRYIGEQHEAQLLDSFTIRDLGPLLLESDIIQDLHRHDFFYILIVSKGTGRHTIDFTDYEIKDNTIFMMRPGQVHSLFLHSESTGYILQFKPDFLYTHNTASQNHLRKLIQYNLYDLKPDGFSRIESILLDAFKEYTDQAKGYREVLKANLSILLIELLRQRKNTGKATLSASPYAQEKLEEFLELAETQSTSHKLVSYYTGLLHLSSYQLSAITKALLDKTPLEIINGYIILEAKRQLLATSHQISLIAYDLGYEDASYFARFFKKHTDVSPEIFRQKYK